ncbi:HesA/MoeB/ThiF family protein [Hymenobacter wooponensis]|uniref:ThiF family adenylyltransferase n=1 Tax=Hymenobacter wooponensis TaxID=1525360 RepID=A0A4Z0MC38_9BACT|nr:ThiF family adenylyltransferase [Hymenobacter wooponensis]TGD76908.1 ThiF family adenylyltransferase [Hymenobacter wooponensis]
MRYGLNIAGFHYEQLQQHLFPGDGFEAVAIALCGRLEVEGLTRLLVHELVCVPHAICQRTSVAVNWPVAEVIEPLMEKARGRDLSVLKIHSHPTGFSEFSERDDLADNDLFGSLFGWFDEAPRPLASAVMLPDGTIFGRVYSSKGAKPIPFEQVLLAGTQVQIWSPTDSTAEVTQAALRNAQAFGEGTYQRMHRLKVGVVGCSGTGSPVVEQLARLNVGHLVLVDPDAVEHKNLNRILNSTAADADAKRNKVDVLAEAVSSMGFHTRITRFPVNAYDSRDALMELASCDVLFGCLDSVDGRELLNLLATYYVLPYFDLGVKFVASADRGITSVSGVVNYLQPGRSSLQTRQVYDAEDLRAASAYRVDPAGHADRVKNQYFKDVPVNRPAVLPVNMYVAAAAIMELLQRIHHYRHGTEECAQLMLSLHGNYLVASSEAELDVDEHLRSVVGRGTTTLLLGLVGLQA